MARTRKKKVTLGGVSQELTVPAGRALEPVQPAETQVAGLGAGWAGMSTAKKALIVGGAAALVLLVVFRKPVAGAASATLTKLRKAVSDAAFLASLPSAGKAYANDIMRVAKEEGLSPFLLASLMEQESNYGTMLSPPGPKGKGDEGHGHGLMQIDDRSNQEWLAKTDARGTPLWQIPYENLKRGAAIYKAKARFLSSAPGNPVVVKAGDYVTKFGAKPGTYKDPRPLKGDALVAATIAAYNTGEGNVLKAVAAGLAPDATTTGRKLPTGGVLKYTQSVLARMTTLFSRAESTSKVA